MSASICIERILTCGTLALLVAGCSGMSIPGLPGTLGAATEKTAAAGQSEHSAQLADPSKSDRSPQSTNQSQKTAGGSDEDGPLEDKYCDSLAESYEVTTSLAKAVRAVAPGAGVQMLTTGKIDVEKTMRDVSKKYVWVPMPVEEAIAKQLYGQMETKNLIVSRDAKITKKLYTKADSAFAAAKEEYKTPFELKLVIIESDEVKAEALPAGYILLHKRAANDLNDDALRFTLGHEIAHSAKRHTSKRLQQRMIDIGVAQQMFEKLSKGGNPNEFVALFGDDNVIKKFGGNFAAYQRDQELQADACSVREMVRARLDAQAAWDQYVSVRDKETVTKTAGSEALTEIIGDFSTHPDDATRSKFLTASIQHHQQAVAAK